MNNPKIKRMTPETIEQLDSWKDNIKLLGMFRNTLMLLIPQETETECYSVFTHEGSNLFLLTRISIGQDGFVMLPVTQLTEGIDLGQIFKMPKEEFLETYRQIFGGESEPENNFGLDGM